MAHPKKSMKGKTVEIKSAYYSSSYGGVCFFVEGSRTGLSIDELDIQWIELRGDTHD